MRHQELNIIPFLYLGDSVKDICLQYASALQEVADENRNYAFHSGMLNQYIVTSEDDDFCALVESSMTKFHHLQLSSHRFLRTTGRKKSLLNAEDKCNLILSRQNPIPEITDSVACRMVLAGKSEEELVIGCYSTIAESIDFFSKHGFVPIDPGKKSETRGFNPDNYPSIYIPRKSLLSTKNKNYVKDYIMHPKEKGYQSLHILFRNPAGKIFELQVRTLNMDRHAESGAANHSSYKSEKYGSFNSKFVTIDRSKIDITRIHAENFDARDVPYDHSGIFTHREFLRLSNF